MAEIDSLEIKLQVQATKANNALTSLSTKLESVGSQLASINGQSLTNLATGVNNLTLAMQQLNASGLKTQDFTRLARQITSIGSVNTAQLDRVASGLRQVTNAFSKLSGISGQAQDISTLASAISRLGYKSVSSAIANMPRLSTELTRMLTALSRVPEINSSVIQMTNSISMLASQGARVGSASQSMTHGISRVGYASERSARKVFSLAAAFGKFYATYFLVIRGLKGLWKSIEKSMDYAETFNYMNVVMEKLGDSAAEKMGEAGEESAKKYTEEFTKTINSLNAKMTGYTVSEYGELMSSNTKNLGLDPTQLMEFQAKIGSVTNSVGMLSEQTVIAQEALTMLASDMSSLTNTDLDTVMTNLSSGLVGQSRALYKYGIDITNTHLKEVALANGIEKNVSAMTQSEKMQLRLLTILQNSEMFWGDQAKTINSVANQYRLLKQQASNLARVLGNLFLPIIQSVLPVINGLVIALQELFTTLGFNIYGGSWLKDLTVEGTGIEEIDEDAEELTDDLDDATSSAKKLKQQLQGFDELNVLTTSSSSTSSSLSSTIDLTKELNSALTEYQKKWNEMFNGMENLALSFADKLKEKLQPLYKLFDDIKNGDWFAVGQDLSSITSSLFDKLSDAIEKIDWKELGQNIGDFLAGQDWVKILDSVGRAIYNALKAVLETWWETFKKSPFKTLTITFAALKFTRLGQALTGAVFSRTLGSALGLKTLGGGLFAFSVAATLTIEWIVFNSVKEWGNKTVDEFVSDKTLSFAEGEETKEAINSLSWSTFFNPEHIKKNFEEAQKGWSGLAKSAKDFAVGIWNIDEAIRNLFNEGSTTHTTSSGRRAGGGGGSYGTPFSDVANTIKSSANTLSEASGIITNSNNTLETELTRTQSFITQNFTDINESTSKSSKLITNTLQTLYDTIGVKNTEIKNELSEKNWTFDSVADGLKKTFQNAIDVIKGLDFSGLFGSVKGVLGVPGYASGGFTTADVFFANENGIPELVGTVGGRTAVASGTEITGISDAVYDTGNTQASLLSTAVGLLQVIADNGNGFNSDAVFNSVRKSAREYTNRTGNSAFY